MTDPRAAIAPHTHRLRTTAPRCRTMTGLTLVELMTALAVGSFIVMGAVSLFVQSRAAHSSVIAQARLHENARFALDRLEADLRMAGYWGLAAHAHRIDGRAGPFDPVPAELTVGNDCGINWAIRLDAPVEAGNDGYRWSCAPFGAAARAGADTLVVRRAAAAPVAAPAAGVIHLRSARAGAGRLFVPPDAGSGAALDEHTAQTHRLVVHGYYVSPSSSLSGGGRAVPSLRVKTLRGGALGPRVMDEEVMPGIEDMQIELGVDTNAPGTPGRGAVDRYVQPDHPMLDPTADGFDPHARVLAVRVWLRVRAKHPEPGFLDTAAYEYADRRDAAPLDGFRRLLVARTIHLRNAAGPP